MTRSGDNAAVDPALDEATVLMAFDPEALGLEGLSASPAGDDLDEQTVLLCGPRVFPMPGKDGASSQLSESSSARRSLRRLRSLMTLRSLPVEPEPLVSLPQRVVDPALDEATQVETWQADLEEATVLMGRERLDALLARHAPAPPSPRSSEEAVLVEDPAAVSPSFILLAQEVPLPGDDGLDEGWSGSFEATEIMQALDAALLQARCEAKSETREEAAGAKLPPVSAAFVLVEDTLWDIDEAVAELLSDETTDGKESAILPSGIGGGRRPPMAEANGPFPFALVPPGPQRARRALASPRRLPAGTPSFPSGQARVARRVWRQALVARAG